MKIEIQQILVEKGFDFAKKVLEENELNWNIQFSPNTGREFLHIDYGIKSPRNSNIVKECRGIAFHFGSWKLARYGFYRFMNFGETGQDDFDASQPIRFEEKADGSVIMLWHDDQEGWVAGTRGRIFNDAKMENGESFADFFWKIFGEKNKLEVLQKDCSYIFELCSINNRIVVFYPNPHLVLLGGRDGSNVEFKDEEVDSIARKLGWIDSDIEQRIRRPKIYEFKSIKDAVENAKTLPGTAEGYVAKQWDESLGRYRRVKIKGDSYKDLHMTFSAKSLNSLVRLVLKNDRSYFELFPEYLPAFDALRKFFTNHAEEAEKVWEANKWIIEDLTKPEKEKRKEFAKSVMQTKFGNYCFSRADGKANSFWDEYNNALEVKSRTKRYIKEYELDKIVGSTWKADVDEED